MLKTCVTIGLALVGLGACVSSGAVQSGTVTYEASLAHGPRFPRHGEIDRSLDSASAPRPRNPGARVAQFPERARRERRGDELVVAFVVDTNGRVEPRSISFVRPPTDPEFQDGVCEQLLAWRFPKQPKRVLAMTPMVFWLTSSPNVKPPPISMAAEKEQLSRMSNDELFAFLERQPHCA